MKLKFKKQRIASLNITSKLIGGNTTNGEPVTTHPPDGLPTDDYLCITDQPTCTSHIDPVNCHTNDSTLKTWSPPDVINIRTKTQRC